MTATETGWFPSCMGARSAPCQKLWRTHPVEPPYEAGELFFFAEDVGIRKISRGGVSLGGWNMTHSSCSRNGITWTI
ncbi:MAG: hypothetical protein ACM3XO_05145 [Bacteroidota bacterium]